MLKKILVHSSGLVKNVYLFNHKTESWKRGLLKFTVISCLALIILIIFLTLLYMIFSYI